jgi:hypothetical protein
MSRPGDRVVPTLTEVLDEQYWQAVDLPEVREAPPAISLDLPLEPDPVIDLVDLSDLAVLGTAAAHEAVAPAGLDAQDDPAEPPPRLSQAEAESSQALLDSELDPVLRRALSNALIEAIPDMVDLLLPLMRRQLADDLVHLTAERTAPAESQR